MYQKPEHTLRSATLIVRLGLICSFLLLAGRLYQLQIAQNGRYQQEANENRFRVIDVAPPRGVIYDRNGEILARNRPSFVIAVVPADLPVDDITTDVDEQARGIERILRSLGADTNPDVALGIAEVMFNRLGRTDFANTVQSAGVDLAFRVVRIPVYSQDEPGEDEDSDEPIGDTQTEVPTIIPDLSEPIELPGLVAVVRRAVALGTQGSSFRPIPVLELVDEELAFRMAEERYRLQGIEVYQEPVRRYPYGELVGHVMGFLGPIPAHAADAYEARGYSDLNERVGLNGLEYTYQDMLRGIPGREIIEVDILGRKNRTVGQIVDPVPGLNLHLSLDIRLQQKMHEALQAQMEETGAPHAVAIAMDPQTGAVLGLVSLPSYNNNIFSEGLGEEYQALDAAAREDPNRNPLINYAIGGLYPPGSTFKLVTSTGALADNVIGPDTVIVDNGPLYLPNRYFPNDPSQAQRFVSWNHQLGINHGSMTVVEALGLSNDIFFYWLGGGYPDRMQGLGQAGLAKWMELFGYGSPAGIDLPGEPSDALTFIPDDQWKRLTWASSWTTGDSYNMSIGQGYVSATPLQVLVSAVAVANGGKVLEPQLVQHATDAEGGLQERFEPQVVRELPVSQEMLSYVQRGMWAVVQAQYGTATNARVDGVEVAGKTGTAEFCLVDPEIEDCVGRDDDGNLPFHAWYTTYAPYENPEIAVVVFLYDGGEGSTVAAPVAQEILDFYFNGTDIPPAGDDEQA